MHTGHQESPCQERMLHRQQSEDYFLHSSQAKWMWWFLRLPAATSAPAFAGHTGTVQYVSSQRHQ